MLAWSQGGLLFLGAFAGAAGAVAFLHHPPPPIFPSEAEKVSEEARVLPREETTKKGSTFSAQSDPGTSMLLPLWERFFALHSK